jgi:hypothetical protein
MARAKNPAYKRQFTKSQNNSAGYFGRSVVLADIRVALGLPQKGKVKLPKMLEWQQQQLGRVMSRATQMDRKLVELEQFVQDRVDKGIAEHARLTGQVLAVPFLIAITEDEMARWQFCFEASNVRSRQPTSFERNCARSWSTFEAPAHRTWLRRWRKPRRPWLMTSPILKAARVKLSSSET